MKLAISRRNAFVLFALAGAAAASFDCATAVQPPGPTGGSGGASSPASSSDASSSTGATSTSTSTASASSTGAGGCAPGLADCDNNPANGCEADTQGSITHCGGCNQPCSNAGGTPSCNAGVCTIQCDAAHQDCDKNVDTGCETDITTVADCGKCGNNCPGGPSATAACVLGKCALSCVGLTGDCNNLPGDGCEQDLSSDDNNCGGCGHVCVGTSCVMGGCQAIVLASGLNTPLSVAVDGTYLYFTEGGSQAASFTDGTLSRVPLAGGPVEVLLSPISEADGLVLDGTNAYIAFGGTSPNFTDGGVLSVPKGGGASTILGSVQGAFPLAFDGTTLFTGGIGPPGVNPGLVASVPILGGGATVLAPNLMSVYGVAVDANNVYFTDLFSGTLSSVPKGGGSVTLLASPLGPYACAVDATNVYFAATTDLDLVPLGGGATSTLVKNGGSIANVALDGGYVYYTDFSANMGTAQGTVGKVPIGGGPSTQLASGLVTPWGMAFDAAYVYIAEYGTGFSDGSIRKVGK